MSIPYPTSFWSPVHGTRASADRVEVIDSGAHPNLHRPMMGVQMSDKHLRILVADDHPCVRRAVRALLESKREWEVCGEASDGQEAIERTQELHPDVVVMDVSMPKLN